MLWVWEFGLDTLVNHMRYSFLGIFLYYDFHTFYTKHVLMGI